MMRITCAIAGLMVIMLASTGTSPAQECNTLDDETRDALLEYTAAFFPLKEQPTCAETTHDAARTIIGRGPDLMPCLLEIYEHGFTKSDLWRLDTLPPKEGKWVVTLIGGIDPGRAIQLYKNERSSLTEGSIERARINLELAKLGDRDGLEALAKCLSDPPEVQESERQMLKTLVNDAIEVIGQHHYQFGLQALRDVQARGWKYNPRLKVFIAQLSEDIAALKVYARETEAGVGVAALRSLARLRRTDILEELAGDRHYRYHNAAEEILEKSQQ